jgi:hypothetical protein
MEDAKLDMLHTLKHFIDSSSMRISEDIIIHISHLYSLKFLFENVSETQS